MAAFVTGAAGFVGLAVTEALLMRGERVIGFDLGRDRPVRWWAF